MKNKIFFGGVLLVFSAISFQVSAQLKVSEDGNVGIHLDDNIKPISLLAIGDSGMHNTSLYVFKNAFHTSGDYYGIYSITNNQTANATLYALYGKSVGMAQTQIGVAGEVSAGTNNTSKRFGVFGSAKAIGTAPRYNYGVYGLVKETSSGLQGSGVGIFGANESTLSLITGAYAGFFKGQTKVNGDFYATTVTQTSDARLKTNIKPIREDVLYQISALRPVEYNWQQVEKTFTDDTITIKEDYFSKDTDFDRKHYGFIAQEVQELFPDLVKEDKDGFLSMNYIEIIPLLVQAIHELSDKVDALQQRDVKRAQRKDAEQAILFQNNPNPFSIDTKISYQLPLNTQIATLYIYNMNGLQVVEYPITSYGNSSIVVNGGLLEAGMYLYSLIADGQVVDTKRMILTK